MSKKKLQERGWEVVTVESLLGLSDEESQIVELHLRLARAIRARRQSLDMSQALLAEKMQSSQSRVAKMEAGDAGVSLDFFVRALLAAGCTLQDIGAIIAADSKTGSAAA